MQMRILWGILLGGLIAGALDIIYAFIVYGPLSYGVTPQQVLQSVAAGWIGRDASRAGEWSTAFLGLGTHFLIATIMAAVFVFAAQSFKALTKNAILWGLLYGLVLYVAMNYIVVPLSAGGANGHFASSFGEATERLQAAFSEIRGGGGDAYPWMLWGTIFTHTALVGVPIALAAKRFAAQSD
jgi:uncharacterized membrane protein YagU involved in acid resistance